MEILKFEDCAELGNHMYEIASDGEAITAVLYYNDAIDLMRWLLDYEDIDVENIKLIEDYFAEYYVTLDECLFLNIKPVKNEDGILDTENTDYMLLDGDVSSKIALHNEGCKKFEFSFDKDEDCCYECCGDCTLCQQVDVDETIEMALDFLDFILGKDD